MESWKIPKYLLGVAWNVMLNYDVESKLKWTNPCVLSANDNDNIDANANNNIFTIKDTILYDPVITLATKDSEISTKLTLKNWKKEFERSVCWNRYKSKSQIKVQQISIYIFLN